MLVDADPVEPELGSELDKVLHKTPFGGATSRPREAPETETDAHAAAPKEPGAPSYDDAYAPEPPNSRGPRVG